MKPQFLLTSRDEGGLAGLWSPTLNHKTRTEQKEICWLRTSGRELEVQCSVMGTDCIDN